MPSSNAKKRAPKASRKKAVFTFHLLQPFFQFLALVAVMFVFTRCSPLAPSTDKAGFGSNSGTSSSTGGAAAAAVLEQSIQESLAEVSSHDAKIVSETEFRKVTEGTLSADDAIEERDAKSLFEQRRRGLGRRAGKLLFVTLPTDRVATLVKDGKIRIDLNERLSRAHEKGRRAFYKNLNKLREDGALDATGYLVMPDTTMKRVQNGFDDLSLSLKVSYGAPTEEQAFLEIRRVDDEASSDETNAALLDAAVREAQALAIVLE